MDIKIAQQMTITELVLENQKLKQERDEAREELNNIRINLGEDAAGFTLLHAVCALQNERDEAREATEKVIVKAKELIARWDEPSWKDTAPTARYINALRIAIRAYEDAK